MSEVSSKDIDYHKHIDNGGISILFRQEFNGCPVSIEFITEYFGYPSVSSKLSGFLSKEDLFEIGRTFIEFSEMVNYDEDEDSDE